MRWIFLLIIILILIGCFVESQKIERKTKTFEDLSTKYSRDRVVFH